MPLGAIDLSMHRAMQRIIDLDQFFSTSFIGEFFEFHCPEETEATQK